MEIYKSIYEMEEIIRKLMDENGIVGEIQNVERVFDAHRNMVAVEVIWGDWKHEHARLDWLVGENIPNLRSIHTTTTEEDGSDCYSAIHYYYFNWGK